MAEEKEQEKKIIIDEDWKNQAQKEKEALKEKQQEPVESQEAHQLPPGDFNSLISLLATQAMFAMGFIATEEGKEPEKNLPLAKFHIDMLEALETKTKGNLTEQESKLLTDALSQLRMGFVSAAK
ncbi:MAG: DUF1844 domain-containing protein [Phycisphaerae bacterium]|jgi:hypothetical protein